MFVLQNQSRRTWLAAAVLAGVVGLTGWQVLMRSGAVIASPRLGVSLALPSQIAGAAVLVGQDQELFARNGVDLTVTRFLIGKLGLQALLAGKVDLAIVADTPFMLAVMQNEKIAIVSSVFESRTSMALVARKDRGINTVSDLAGKTVGTIPRTNAEYFLETLLLSEGVPGASVHVTDLKPEKLVSDLERGAVDAATIWNPELARLEREWGARAVVLRNEAVFVHRFVLVGSKAWLDLHPLEVARVLAALRDGNQFIQDQPEQARRIIGASLGIESGELAKSFNAGDFTLSLSQSLLMALDDQARWAMRRQLAPARPTPDFLDYVRQGALESVLPSAVKLIR
jgi:NitT/TauT family transport system substrate-binding protein